jgi:hypothetical protein
MAPQARPKSSDPCPCGSGKKYKECCAVKMEQRRRAVRKTKSAAKWLGAFAAIALIIYGLSQMSGVAYGEDDIAVVDFSTLSSSERRSALQAANSARCTCGCGMGLAQCVATDSTCPIRTQNVERIRTIVNESRAPAGS